MSALIWLSVLAKAVSTTIVVVSASLAAQALGPFWGALIARLPVSAGPAYIFLALEHEPEFLAKSALYSAVANAATGLFLILFVLLGRHISFWPCLAVATTFWLSSSFVLQSIDWTTSGVVALNLLVYAPSMYLLKKDDPKVSSGPSFLPRPSELAVRAGAVALFVTIIVTVSNLLGPTVTGFAAVFPISLISLLVILHSRVGGSAAVHVAINALAPMLGFCAMLLVISSTTSSYGIAIAFSLGLTISLIWSGVLGILKSCEK